MGNVNTSGKEPIVETEANATAEPIVETATEANAVAEIALFIDELDGSVTKERLIEVFDRMGDMESVLVCVDPATGEPLGYGYVCYTNPEDAAKAMAVLNLSSLNGKQIRISYSNREGSISGISSNETVFFKGLDKGFNKKKAKDIFSAYGKVMSCAVELDSTGISKGCGYVQFDNEEHVLNATEHLNGAELNGEILYVGPLGFEPKFSKVFVKNFSEWMTEEDLESRFSEFGLVEDVDVARDEDGTSKCSAFVYFEKWEDAAKSVEELHGKIIDDKKWHVERALEGPEAMTNLCIKNIDYMIEHDTFEFSRFGTITSCRITKMNAKWIGSKHLYVGLGERRRTLQEVVDDIARSEQRRKFGDRLYSLVEPLMAEAAPKITGMLLEMDEADVLQLMESPEALKAKVSEAMEVLRSVHK